MRQALTAALFALALLAGPAPAQDVTVGGNTLTFQFDEEQGEPLIDFIDLAKVLLGKPIQYAPTEVGDARIFIIGTIEVDKDRFFQFFQAVLKSYDFIVMEYGPTGGSFLKVQKVGVGGAGARGGGGLARSQAPIVPREQLEAYAEDPATLITTSIPLKFIDARSAMASFQPFFDTSVEGIRNVENSNSLVITGFGTVVWGVDKLIKLVDVPPFEPQPHIAKRELLNTSVDDIETVLTELLGAAQGLRPGQTAQNQQANTLANRQVEPRIILEPASNSLLLVGEEEMVERIQSWIDILDVEVEPRGFTHVYRLENTDAKTLEEVLKDVLSETQSSGTANRPGQAAGGAASLEVQASVVADEISNSLVITAGDRKYAELLETIRSLDIRRRQVLVEAAIVETQESLNDTWRAGVATANSMGGDNGVGFVSNFGTTLGSFNDDGSLNVAGTISGFEGSNAGTLAAFQTGTSDVPIPVLLQWLSSRTKTRILSRPSVLTNDNEEAELASEEQTSYQTTSTTQNGVTNTNFDQVEAGINLNVSPTISAGNYLRLRVRLEVSSFQPSRSGNPDAPPDITRREIDTPITVPDGATIILGGLVTHSATELDSKIPWLGDLPLIGWLFRADEDSQSDLYLYIFITAHIIDGDFALLNEISAARKQDVDRLGGDLTELVGSLSADPDADLPALTDLDDLFDMPTPALPSSGLREPDGPLAEER